MRRLVVVLVVAGFAGGCGEPSTPDDWPVRDGRYQARVYDRVSDCPELDGVLYRNGIQLIVTAGDGQEVQVASPSGTFYGERDGDGLRVVEAFEGAERGVAGGGWSWEYRAEMVAALNARGALAGTIQVRSVDTYRSAEGEEWEYPYEEQWSFDARWTGPEQDFGERAHSLASAIDDGYCP